MVEYVCLHCHLLELNLRESARASMAIFTIYALYLHYSLLQKVDLIYFLYIFRELKLRNYTPEDEELKERQVPKAKPASGENSWPHNQRTQRTDNYAHKDYGCNNSDLKKNKKCQHQHLWGQSTWSGRDRSLKLSVARLLQLLWSNDCLINIHLLQWRIK